MPKQRVRVVTVQLTVLVDESIPNGKAQLISTKQYPQSLSLLEHRTGKLSGIEFT